MQVKSIAECSLSTFIKLPFVYKTFVLSIFEWSLKTGFTVCGDIIYQVLFNIAWTIPYPKPSVCGPPC